MVNPERTPDAFPVFFSKKTIGIAGFKVHRTLS